MFSEYRRDYDWDFKNGFFRTGNKNGLPKPDPIRYLDYTPVSRPPRATPFSGRAVTQRMLKQCGERRKILNLSTPQIDNCQTTYQSAFKEEDNYFPPMSIYQKAAQEYTDKLNEYSERNFLQRKLPKENEESIADLTTEELLTKDRLYQEKVNAVMGNPKEEEHLSPSDLADAALKELKKDSTLRPEVWNASRPHRDRAWNSYEYALPYSLDQTRVHLRNNYKPVLQHLK